MTDDTSRITTLRRLAEADMSDGCCGGGVGPVPYALCTDCPRRNQATEADRIQADAYAAFDRWLAAQPDEVQELTLLEQIEVYAALEPKP